LATFRGAVVGPVRGIDPAAAPSEQGVIDSEDQRRADRHQMPDNQPQHRQAHRVGVPAGGGEEAVRPAVVF
jgi:hypothetical protein